MSQEPGMLSKQMLNGGKEEDQVHRNLGQDIALKLLELYYGTGRDVRTVNFFLSYNLAKLLLEKKFNITRNYESTSQRDPYYLE